MVKGLGVTVCFGEKSEKQEVAHIIVTTVGYLNSKLSARGSKMSLKSVKLVIFDEADEVFNHADN